MKSQFPREPLPMHMKFPDTSQWKVSTHAEYLAARDLELADSLRKQGLLPSSILAQQAATPTSRFKDGDEVTHLIHGRGTLRGSPQLSQGEIVWNIDFRAGRAICQESYLRPYRNLSSYNTAFPPVGVRAKVGMHVRNKSHKRVGRVTLVDDVNETLDAHWSDGSGGCCAVDWSDFEFAHLLVAGIPIFHSDGVSGETVVYHDERPAPVVTSRVRVCAKCGNQSKHAESETSMGLCFDCFEARR